MVLGRTEFGRYSLLFPPDTHTELLSSSILPIDHDPPALWTVLSAPGTAMLSHGQQDD